MQRIVLAASFLITTIFAACGAPAAQGPGTASTASPGAGGGAPGPGSDMECHEEVKTGSSISHQVCRTKDQAADDRRGAEEMIGQPHTNATPSH